MRRVQLPDGFLRASRNPSVAYAFQKAFLPEGFASTAANSPPRLILEWFFTQRHLACLKLPAEEWDRYRLVQYTIPAICVFRWAGCLDAAGGPHSHIEQLDKYFKAFLEVNSLTLFGDWPPDQVLDALITMPWYQQLEQWRAAIEARDGGIWTGSFPNLLEPPPFVITRAMSPSQDAAYPALVWRRGHCRLVQSPEDEDVTRADGWHAYGEPDVEQSPLPIPAPNTPADQIEAKVDKNSPVVQARAKRRQAVIDPPMIKMGLSIPRLATRAGVSAWTVRSYRDGLTMPHSPQRAAIAQTLGLADLPE